MANPQVRAVGTVVSGTGDISVGLPTGWQQNDILLLVLECANEGVIVPLGYTEIIRRGAGTPGTNSGMELVCAWKRAGASESNPLVVDSGDHTSGVLLAISGCLVDSDPVFSALAVTQSTDTGTVQFYGDSATESNNNLVVYLIAGNRDATSTNDVGTLNNSNLTSLTEHVDSWHALGFGGGLYVASGVKLEAGSIDHPDASITTQTFIQGSVVLLPEVETVYSDLYEATYTVYEAVESDYVVEYDVPDPAILAPAWFDILTSGKNTWYDLEEYNTPGDVIASLEVTWDIAGLVYQSSASVEYDIYARRENDLSVEYDLYDETGIIGGGGPLPWGTASNIQSAQWDIFFAAPFQPLNVIYQLKVARERDYTPSYTIFNAPYADLGVEYDMSGIQITDATFEYDVIEPVETDFTAEFDIYEPITADLTATYQVEALVAANYFFAEYNVTSTVESDLATAYDVFNPVDPQELVLDYTVYNSAASNIVFVWQVPQSYNTFNNLAVVYQIERPARRVPNVKGMKLGQAKQVLQEAGLNVGRITYGT